MSATSCPGDACYALVRSTFLTEVTARRSTAVGPPSTSEPADSSTTTTSTTTTTPGAPATAASAPSAVDATAHDRPSDERWPMVAVLSAVAAAGAAALVAIRRRRA
jgi:hypothetical protein